MNNPRISVCQTVQQGCTECGECLHECAFLQRHGTPKQIASQWDITDPNCRQIPFECSLCGLCTAVCPEPIEPDRLFPTLRQAVVEQFGLPSAGYRSLLTYERLGCSSLLTQAALPPDCHTIFFPGCALAGQSPQAILGTYAHLRQAFPDLGLVLDCCSKPTESLGLTAVADQRFTALTAALYRHGIRRVLVACPNCWQQFHQKDTGLIVETVYQALALHPPEVPDGGRPVRVHDPCPSRFDLPTQQAVRLLLGADLLPEMTHSKDTTQCCGVGGAVGVIDPEMALQWNRLRQEERQGAELVSYCSECVAQLHREQTPCHHVLERLFTDPQAGHQKRPRWRHYLNRWWLKRRVRRIGGTRQIRLRC